MAYLRAVLNHDDTVWFLGDANSKKRSRGTWVFEVDNIPGMHGDGKPITAAASTTRKWVEAQDTLRDKSTVVRARVTSIERTADGLFELTASKKGRTEKALARYVILATGVMDVQPLIADSIEPVFPYANRGDLIYCVRCDGHRVIGKALAVIAPAQTGAGIANLMHERYGVNNVHVLTHGDREPATGETAELAERYGVSVLTAPIVDIVGDPNGDGLQGFTLADGTTVHAEKAIVALGTIVYSDLAKQLGAELADDGRVITDVSGHTSAAGLYAAGDVVAHKKMQIYTGWDEAVDAADAINRRLRAKRRSALPVEKAARLGEGELSLPC